MKKSGIFWHISHEPLAGYCWDYKERCDYIKANKPEKEIAIRIKLFKPVICRPPVDIYTASIIKILRASATICRGLYKELMRRDRNVDNYGLCELGREHALARYNAAYDTVTEAIAQFNEEIKGHMDVMLPLHEIECGCDWTEEGGIKFPEEV